MFSIDCISDNDYYIILKDNEYYIKISKNNDINIVKKYFNIVD